MGEGDDDYVEDKLSTPKNQLPYYISLSKTKKQIESTINGVYVMSFEFQAHFNSFKVRILSLQKVVSIINQ